MTDRQCAAGRPLAIYVHIPYCARKCAYCDFNSYDRFGEAQVERYLAALRREMALAARRPEVAGRPVTSVFFGGGTPTVLSGGQLAGLLSALTGLFPLAPGAEVTSEANPGTVDEAKLASMRQAGFNRLSLGVQARQDHLLERLGRIHRAPEVEAGVRAARRSGFGSVNLDLMYGLPGQTLADWRETLDWAVSLGPEHISAYSLIIEPGTPFGALHERGLLSLPGEDLEAAMDEMTLEVLPRNGLEPYEVSNFARSGYRCRHNLVYWHNEEYLGLGAGAFSFLGGERFWNLRRPQDYEAAVLEQDRLPVEDRERPDRATSMGETVMLGLRLTDGLELERFRRRFGTSLQEAYPAVLEKLVRQGLVETGADHVRLTKRGRQVGNRVFAEFLPA
ncbi:MAG: radical SAM family heme chaperone HemW [Bacillota bacterium]